MVNDHLDMLSTRKSLATEHQGFHWLRWLRHFLYMPWRTRYYFNQQAKEEISKAVTQAEQGHAGEIQVIIEGHLPLQQALTGSTQQRAKQLFAEHGVWDTAHNSGVLLYINLCEHQVEILADRGIHRYVNADHWQQICNQVTALLAQEKYLDGVLIGIDLMGKTLNDYYDKAFKDVGNELGDGALFL
jgi:uncharacterized membrane protein